MCALGGSVIGSVLSEASPRDQRSLWNGMNYLPLPSVTTFLSVILNEPDGILNRKF